MATLGDVVPDGREEEHVSKTIRVTPAQVRAAKLKVKRSALSGKQVSAGVSAIANARRLEPVRLDRAS